MKRILALALAALTLCACASAQSGLNAEKKPATDITAQKNAQVYQLLDFSDEQEGEFASRGLIAAPESLTITAENGMTIWPQDAYNFVREAETAPDTANPSLWRNTQYNARYGLFEVTDGIYQVRGYDVSNVTFVRSEHGWIVMDCASSRYTAAEALKLFRQEMGDDPIVAVIISHAHVDHYGGIEGLISAGDAADPTLPLSEQIASGKTAIIVPQGFVSAVMKENVFVSSAMKRRAIYQYGNFLPYDAQGRLSVGIGLTVPLVGTGYIAPTLEITDALTELEIDGVKAVFQLTPGTESPAEMNTYFPEMKALWMAENCTGTMHNLYTLRGAEVRDANDWARYITEAQTLFGATRRSCSSPTTGRTGAADVVRRIPDQHRRRVQVHRTTRRCSTSIEGYTADEIAHMIELPEALEKVWYTRQYYGTLDAQRQGGLSEVHGLVRREPGAPGRAGADRVRQEAGRIPGRRGQGAGAWRAPDYRKGRISVGRGDHQRAGLRRPGQSGRPHICAPTRWSSWAIRRSPAPWRNAYLVAAFELRGGTESYPQTGRIGVGTTAQGMDAQTMLDYMGIMLDAEKLADRSFTVNLRLDGRRRLPAEASPRRAAVL